MLVLLSLLGCPADPPPTETDTDTDVVDPCAEDADADGANVCDDCDDADPARFPGNVEPCDGVDNDCDGGATGEEPAGDALACTACDDAGYWAVASGPDEGLVEALRTAMDGDRCDYDRAREFLFMELDNDGDSVECVYTGETYAVTSFPPNYSLVNTEHTWPQSLGADRDPQQCDLHHLFVSDADVNSIRGNRPYGEVVDVDGTYGGSLAGRDAEGRLVFEPRDGHKGDAIRAIVYFHARWGDYLDGSSGFGDWPGFYAINLEVASAWDEADPPDAREIARTFAIREEQGNANPFVVCPGLLDRYVALTTD